MNILLTGAAGFIGENFLRFWKSTERTDNLILLTSREIPGFPCVLHKEYTFSVEDFTSAGVDQIDAVILLGAYVEHGKEPEMVRKHLSSVNNIDYLLHHLPNVPKKVVYCSSIAVYGFNQERAYVSNAKVTYSELSAVIPERTYALSKCLGERLVEEWCVEHGCMSQIVRIGRIYGPSKIVNDFLGAVLACAKSGKEFSLYAPKQQYWNYVYVDDVCQQLLRTVYLEDDFGVINLTSSCHYTTLELLEAVKDVCPSFSYTVREDVESYGMDRIFDSLKRERLLGEEKWTIRQGVQQIIYDDV